MTKVSSLTVVPTAAMLALVLLVNPVPSQVQTQVECGGNLNFYGRHVTTAFICTADLPDPPPTGSFDEAAQEANEWFQMWLTGSFVCSDCPGPPGPCEKTAFSEPEAPYFYVSSTGSTNCEFTVTAGCPGNPLLTKITATCSAEVQLTRVCADC